MPDKEEAAGLREVADTVSCHLADMLQQLTAVNAAKPSERVAVRQGKPGVAHGAWRGSGSGKCLLTHCFLPAEEAEDPACIPIFWVSKWVDYSDKYGLGKYCRWQMLQAFLVSEGAGKSLDWGIS